MTKHYFLLGLAILLSAHFGRLSASEFYHQDELFGASNSIIEKISADGSTFIGWSNDETLGWAGFVWNQRTGLVQLQHPDFERNSALAVSPDGSRVWTWSSNGCHDSPYTGQGAVVESTMDGGSHANIIPFSCREGWMSFWQIVASPDGDVFVGRSATSDGVNHSIKRFRATADGYIEETILTDTWGNLHHVSADGTVLVAFGGNREMDVCCAWRWTEESGEIMELGTLPGYTYSEVGGILGEGDIASADGSVVVGRVMRATEEFFVSVSQAFRWTVEGGMVGLGFLEGHDDSHAVGVSSDGQVVLGRSGGDYSSGDTPSSLMRAFVWDATNGMRNLQQVLLNEFGLGAELDGLRLSGGLGISENRQVLYGYARTWEVNGPRERWVAMLDRPLVAFTPSDVVGDLTNDRVVDVRDIDVLRSAIRDGSTELPYDLNGSGSVEIGDLTALIHGALNTWFGDANLDGEFSSSDLVTVFQAGQYEDEIVGNSTWETGDWNADGDFTTSDLVAAFQDGGYEQGPRAAINSVPEPSSLGMTLLITLALVHRRHQATSPASDAATP